MRKIIRKKKNSSKIPFITIIVTLSVFFAISILLVSNLRIYNERVELREYIINKEEELRILRERSNWADGLDLNQAEDDFIVEKIAREQLLLKKPGEEVVFIIFPETEIMEVKEEEKPFIWWNPFTWKMWPE